MSGSLVPVVDDDVDELMRWFTDARSVDLWGGPRFRFPFTRESFLEDCHWNEFASFRLQDEAGAFAAFGQINERYDRVHLARLVANPTMRGRGIGKRLVHELLEEAAREFDYPQCGLFVYRENTPALRCYESAGFRIVDYPAKAPMPELCYYLTRSI